MKYIKLFENFEDGEKNIADEFSALLGFDVNLAIEAQKILNLSQRGIQQWFEKECLKENPNMVLINELKSHGIQFELLKKDIHWASYNCYLGLVKIHIERGVSKESRESHKETPLHLASHQNCDKVVQFLLEIGADKNAIDEDQRTPLHYACYYDSVDVAHLLIDSGANINQQDIYGLTPLHLSTMRSQMKVAKLLLDKGADSTITNKEGKTAWEYAQSEYQESMPELNPSFSREIIEENDNSFDELMKEFDIDFDEYKAINKIISYSSTYNKNRFNEELKKKNPDKWFIEKVFTLGVIPITKEDINKEIEWYDPHLDEMRESTLIHYAAYLDSVTLIKYLIEKGFNSERGDYEWRTPLHYAAAYGSENALGFLIDDATTIDKRSYQNWTPLHEACYYGNEMCARMLIQSEANKEAKTESARTPLHLAADNNNLNCVKLLVEYGANIDAESENKWTPLHLVSMKSHLNAVSSAEFLITNGADINCKDDQGLTPLHWAVFYNAEEMVKLLLQKGADKTIESKKGKTAWDIAGDVDEWKLKEKVPELNPNFTT